LHLRNDCGRFGDAFSRKEVVPENDISAKRRKKTAGQTPSVKPCGFATSLSEGGSGETGSFAPEPEALPMRKAPSLRGLSPQATGGVCPKRKKAPGSGVLLGAIV